MQAIPDIRWLNAGDLVRWEYSPHKVPVPRVRAVQKVLLRDGFPAPFLVHFEQDARTVLGGDELLLAVQRTLTERPDATFPGAQCPQLVPVRVVEGTRRLFLEATLDLGPTWTSDIAEVLLQRCLRIMDADGRPVDVLGKTVWEVLWEERAEAAETMDYLW